MLRQKAISRGIRACSTTASDRGFAPSNLIRWASMVQGQRPYSAIFRQPAGLQMRLADGGLLASLLVGRRGRTTNSPPQFGHFPPRTVSAHDAQKVHSNEQTRATVDSGGKSLSQHSQLGLSSSIRFSRWMMMWNRLNGIVCKGPNDPVVRAELKDLSGKAAPSPFVVEGNGIDAGKN